MFPPPQLPPILFPTHFSSLQNGSLKPFEHLFQPVGGKFIYLGHMPKEKREIHVKFVQGMSAEIAYFRELAEGKWFMVIMEDPAKHVMPLIADTVTNWHLQTTRECVKRLHQQDYVHDDMRDVNIVLSTTDPRKCNPLPVDHILIDQS